MKKIPNFLFAILFLFVFCFNLKAQPANSPVKSESDREKEIAAIVNYVTQNRQKIMQEGLRFYNARQYTDAVALYNKILTVIPDDGEAITMRTLSMTGARSVNAEDVIRNYVRALKIKPGDVNASYHLGNALYDEGMMDEALPHLRAAIKGGVKNYYLFLYSGRAGFFAGSYETCVEDLNAAIDLHAYGYSGAREQILWKGECYAEAGNRGAAKAAFGSAIGIEAGYKWTYGNRIFEDTQARCKSNAAEKYADALKNYEKGKIYEAYRDAHTAIKCDPKHVPSLKLRLKIESADSNLKLHAKVHAHQLRKIENPDAPGYDAPPAGEKRQELFKRYFAEAEKYFNANQPLEALGRVNDAIQLSPENADALLLRARAIVTQSDVSITPLAWRDATAALKINPRLALAYNVRGLVYEREKNPAEALKEFDKSLAINPNEEKSIYNRARMFAALKQFDKAITEMNALIEKNAASTHYYRYRSAVHYDAKQFPEALKDATRAIELDKKNAAAYYLLVITHDALGNRAAADEAHLWIISNDGELAKNAKLQNRPSLKDIQAKYTAEIERRKNAEAVARQNESEAKKRSEAADFKYKQQRAIAAYPQAHQDLEFALARYENAVNKYNRAGEAQFLLKGTLADAYRALEQARGIINGFLKEHGSYLPRDMYDHLLEDYGKIPSSPY